MKRGSKGSSGGRTEFAWEGEMRAQGDAPRASRERAPWDDDDKEERNKAMTGNGRGRRQGNSMVTKRPQSCFRRRRALVLRCVACA